MRSFAIALIATLVLAGCGQNASKKAPTAAEATQALQARMQGLPIVEAAVSSCQPGLFDGAAVQVCDFCIVTVSGASAGPEPEAPRFLEAVRRKGSGAFRRAFSLEHPEIAPASGQDGVWVSEPKTLRIEPPSRRAPLSPALMVQAGYDPAADRFPTRFMSDVPAGVLQRFTDTEALRRGSAALVSGCTDEPAGAPSAPATQAAAVEAPPTPPGGPDVEFRVARPALTVFARLATAPARTPLMPGVTQTIHSAAAPGGIVADIALAGGAARATYTISPEGRNTEVDVSVARVSGEVPDARLGEIAAAIARVAAADAMRPPGADFANLRFDVTNRQPQTYAYLAMITTENENTIRTAVGQSVDAIKALMEQQGTTIQGQPISVRVSSFRGEARFRAGVAIFGPPPATPVPGVQLADTPAGATLRVIYRGQPAGAARVHEQLLAFATATRLRPGQIYELYRENVAGNGPADRDIYLPVAGDAAAARRLIAAGGIGGTESAVPSPSRQGKGAKLPRRRG